MGLYASSVRKLILPYLLKRDHRESALKHLRFFEESQYWSRQRLQDYQWERLQALLKHAYETSPYYKKIFGDRGLTPKSFKSFDDIRQLPILTRNDLFDHGSEIISGQYKKESLEEALTGGTTGQQASIFRDQESFNIKLAIAWRHEGWMGRKPCDRMAYLWPAHIDFRHDQAWKSKFKNRYLLGDASYCVGMNDPHAFGEFYRDIMSYGPKYMKIFPSATVPFAQFILDTGKRPPRMKGIMATGEVLHERDRRLIEEVFGCPVQDMYGSRETGNTSCECSAREGLHIAMETSFVEFVSEGRWVDEGEEGEILITDLTNYGFPMIRYQINDYGIPMKQSCSCGRGLSFMSPGVGRVQDYFYTPDGVRHAGLVLGYHMSSDHDVKIGQIQIVQKGLKDYLIRITNRPEPTERVFDFIRRQMHKIVGEGINIEIVIVDEIPREKSGKTRFVICEIEAPGINK